eukprot:6309842-Amphidinium_carterae.1
MPLIAWTSWLSIYHKKVTWQGKGWLHSSGMVDSLQGPGGSPQCEHGTGLGSLACGAGLAACTGKELKRAHKQRYDQCLSKTRRCQQEPAKPRKRYGWRAYWAIQCFNSSVLYMPFTIPALVAVAGKMHLPLQHRTSRQLTFVMTKMTSHHITPPATTQPTIQQHDSLSNTQTRLALQQWHSARQ